MIARTLTVLSGAMLLLAAPSFAPLWAQEPPAAVPQSPPAPPDAQTQAREREAVEPAVSTPAVADPGEQPIAEGGSIVPPPPESSGERAASQEPAQPGPAAQDSSSPGAATAPGRFRTMDRLELESTAITGNRELPKVLYIVPWKKADLGDLVGRPANSLLDEVLTPVDRDVFKRQTDYFTKLEATPAGGAAEPAQKPAAQPQPQPQPPQR